MAINGGVICLQDIRIQKKQGDVGVGMAIGWFASQGYTVYIPLTNNQEYELVVDVGGALNRVQVKTTTYKAPSGKYFVSLTIKGGNRTSIGKIKKFNTGKVDSVFIVTGDNEFYLIPSSRIESRQTITLCDEYEEFNPPKGTIDVWDDKEVL